MTETLSRGTLAALPMTWACDASLRLTIVAAKSGTKRTNYAGDPLPPLGGTSG